MSKYQIVLPEDHAVDYSLAVERGSNGELVAKFSMTMITEHEIELIGSRSGKVLARLEPIPVPEARYLAIPAKNSFPADETPEET